MTTEIFICLLFLSVLHGSCDAVQYFNVLEEQEAGTFVGNITRRNNFKYYFRGQVDHFTINPDYGSIFTKTKIDREKLVSDDLKYVIVSSFPVYAIEISIKVLDINDNEPRFKLPKVNIEVLESVEVGSLIPLESATDPDLGQNSVKNYSIVSGNVDDKFSIEIILNLLHLKVKKKLDRETRSSYNLNISASDNGSPRKYGYVTLNITVLDVNDNAPLFNPTAYRVDIFENATIGTFLSQIQATDQDADINGQISYSLKENTYFAINPANGVISLKSQLDHEKDSSVSLSVQAFDGGSSPLSAKATVTVSVKDVNDNKPVINSNGITHKRLMENKMKSNFLFLTVTDKDFKPVRMAIISGNNGNKFSLSTFSSDYYFLSTRVALDREEQARYLLLLRAYDSGVPQLHSDYQLLVDVVDENDNKPVFGKGQYFSKIKEGCPVGSYVADVRASDLDIGSNSIIKYSIIGGNYNNWFHILETTGLITTKSDAIDFDILRNPSIILSITATDLGKPPLHANATVNITIENSNESPPQFTQALYAVSVNESSPVNSVVLKVTARDKDKGVDGEIQYQFHYPSELDVNTFTINSLTGAIYLRRKLDYLHDKSFSFYILATDKGVPKKHSKTRVTIDVIDMDDHTPVFSSAKIHVNIIASNTPGIIGTFKALDFDSGVHGQVRYSIEIPSCCNYFAVSPVTGMLNTTRSLNAGNIYELSIRAISNGKIARSSVSIVVVENLLANPSFSRDEYSFHVEENAVGKLVGKPDIMPTTESILYSIEAGNELDLFGINKNGDIFTKKSIDREKYSSFVLTVVARTNQTLFLTAKATAAISIEDLNDNNPFLLKQEMSDFFVMEDATIGHQVFTVFANDADCGANGMLRYSIQHDESGKVPFEIDPTTGSVFLSQTLINMDKSQYRIDVRVSDIGTPRQYLTAHFWINVIDVNDHSPTFSVPHYNVIVQRNMSVNSRFYKLIAKDSDFGNNSKVLYKIQSGNTGNIFGIFPSGWVYLKAMALSGNINYFLLEIVAYDQGNPQRSSMARLSIFVEKTSALRIFKSSVFHASVTENQPSNIFVTDLNNNVVNRIANISFKLYKQSLYFDISPKSGIVRTKVTIDREVISSSGNDTVISLVTAEQNISNSTVKESCILVVKISDANDNAPVFERAHYVAFVNETAQAGTFVANVHAIDKDSPTLSTVSYKMRPAQSHFAIDSSSGVISISKSNPMLDYEAQKSYNLTIEATDSRNSSLFTSCQVFIYVKDQNDNKPVFAKSVTTLSISEATTVGSSLFKFFATDKDTGMNGFVTYTLSSSTSQDTFKINKYSGEMYLAKAVDFEIINSYDVIITAVDHGLPSLQETLAVKIHIEDFNDNRPMFTAEPTEIFVAENIPLSSVIGQCSASDGDSGSNKVIRYTVAQQGPAAIGFLVNPSNCQITTNVRLDREQFNAYYIIIKAEDSALNAKQRLSSTKNISIIVQDVNDNIPVFVPPLAAGFTRTSATGWEIIKVQAADLDAGANGTVRYTINNKLDSACFSINAETGSVKVVAPLSINKKIFEIEVKANDLGSKEQKHASAALRFFVRGTPSNAPICSGTAQTSLNENVGIGAKVYKAAAVSTESNSQMMYFMKSGNVGNTFYVNSSTGWIFTRRSIDFDSGVHSYSLVIFAVEKAGTLPKSAECNVRIDIQDVNDNAPKFRSLVTEVFVPENAKVGYEVYQFHAMDIDSGQNGLVEYAITNGNELSTFAMNSNTGKITLGKLLDRETTSLYILTVEASNKGSQKSQAQLKVKVADVNDNKPTFNQTFYSFTIKENSPKYSYVGTVKATDNDAGRNKEIYYAIIDKDQDSFAIEHTTGAIRVAGVVDYERLPNYMFDVRAVDYGEPRLSSTVTVFVNLEDSNDNCPIFSRANHAAEIRENLPSGAFVFKVVATDEDSGDNGQVTYEIVDGNSKDSFTISSNGDVRTKRKLDREETPYFRLILRALDKKSSSERNCLSYAVLAVNVLDVNDNAPALNKPHVIRIAESSSVGTIIHTFTATDSDFGVNSTLRFLFQEPTEASSVFHLAENGGLLLTSRLDYETKKEYYVNISVSDLGNPSLSSVSQVTLSVLDVNDNNPIISPHPSSISVLENATIGMTLIEFSASDLDSGENSRITYSIIIGNHNGTFSIEPASGILYVAKALDRESKSTFLLEIEARDNGLPWRRGITSLNVGVVDVNDCTPKFSSPSYNVSVLENSVVGPILTVTAWDCDISSNAMLRYSLENSQLSNKFAIDAAAGRITLLQALDREFMNLVKLTVKARDNGVPPLSGTTTIFVNILDENDNTPIIAPSNVTKSVRENLNGNIEVQRFRITDSDYGLNSTVDVNLVNDLGTFQLVKSGNDYVLSTTRGLDREIKDSHSLQLEASDRGNPKKTSVANVHVSVQDDNDSPPVFSKERYEFKTQSNAPVGSFVAQVTATDKDTLANSKMKFSVTSGNNSYVSIEQDTGIIITEMVIPVNTIFEITVEVTDPTKPQFKDSATVVIQTATGYPIFSHGNLYVAISESAPKGTFIKKVNATSNEVGPAAVLHYFIHSGNVKNAFRIEEQTGEIRLNSALDYETTRIHSLWIEARDSKNPPQSSYVKLVITVRNENDSAPIITGPKGSVFFTENQGSNAFVTRVVAVDVDNPSSTARLRYSLGGSAASLPFSIDSVNGEIRSTKLLDREEIDSYVLQVIVYPIGKRSFSATHNLSIVIQDINDNQPIIHSPNEIRIPENLPINSQVLLMNVTDKDKGPNGLVTFYLISDTFSIDESTGRITLIKSLDREMQQTYALSIQVRDASYQKIHQLTITVTDVNDSPPYFQSNQIFVNVSESTPVGQIFGVVKAQDRDIGNNAVCFYHIEPRSGYGFVSVDPLSGSLTLRKQVKFVKSAVLQKPDKTLFNLILKARNVYPPFYVTQTQLIVRVLDANDHAPVFSQSSYHAYVESIAAIGFIVTTVSASDAYDVGDNADVAYSMIGGNGSSVFMLTVNRIKVKGSLQSYIGSVLQVLIEASDNGVPKQKSTTKVNIEVTEENRHSPAFTAAKFEVTVPENKQLYKELRKVVARDEDSGGNGELTYSITSGNLDGIFGIGLKNGSLYLVKSLDYEKTSSHSLVIEAKDSAKVNKRSSTVTVEVKVTDVNDNRPVFTSKQFTATVIENALASTLVTKVIATDADSAPSNTISYEISDPTGRVFFTIESNTGIIRTRTGIDYETIQAFIIKVTASDSGIPVLSSTVDVKINVIGVNEYNPRFTSKSFNFTVSRHAEVNNMIGKVSAIDNDKGIDGVSVFLPRFSVEKSPFKLDITSGNIQVRRRLSIGSYILPIFVKNVMKRNLEPSDVDQATIYINVVEGNQPPVFTSTSYLASIQENSPSGRSVLKVSARDNDGGSVRYEIIRQIPNQAFIVNPVTGVISVSGNLDREKTPQFELTVRASDYGTPSASNTTKVVLRVTDVNDNQPVIVNCNGSVYENASIGTIVTRVAVTDEDIDPNRGPFTYTTSAGDFSVNSIGEVRVAATLDREKSALYNITIDVRDNGVPAQQSRGYCIIKIIDISDVMPRRRNPLVIVNILGPFPAGGLIGDLSPNDPDSSDKYTCTIDSAHSIFHFEPSSCRMHVASHRNIGHKTVNFTAKSHDARIHDSAKIDFIPVINATVNKILFLRLEGVTKTVLAFTNNTILKLNRFLESISLTGMSIQVIGYKQQVPRTLDLLIAVLDKQSFASLPVATATTVLSTNLVQIQQITGSSSIQFPFKACTKVNACMNNGTCYEMRSIDNHNTLWNSQTVIFVAIAFKALPACSCKPGFYGSRCEKIVSSCTPNPCQNGGTCNEKNVDGLMANTCSCKAGYTGKYCQDDVNECVLSPCKNSGSCVNVYGNYYCQCGAKYTGRNCENTVDFCNPNPCLFGGTCISNDASFTCICKFGNQGKFCEVNPMTFDALSYLAFNSFAHRPLNVSMDFATYDKDSLLLYGFDRARTGALSPFVGFELVGGRIRFSYNFGSSVKRLSIETVQVDDGNWHTASFYLSGQKLQVRVDKTNKQAFLNEASQTPDLKSSPLYIAGVPSIDAILKRPKQVSVDDFTGCMRNIYINGYHIDKSTAVTSKGVTSGCANATGCSNSICKNGKCIDNWKGFQCQCNSGFSGETCAADAKPFTFGGKSFVMFKLKESYRRKLKLVDGSSPLRRKRAIVPELPTKNSFSIEFRTRQANGILLFAEDIGGNFTVLHIDNGGVHYKFDLGSKGSGTMAIRRPLINDGKWHNISLVVNEKTVSLSLDSNQASQNSFSVSPHKFYSVYTDTLSIAGTQTPRSIDGKALANFHGCLTKISLNNENLAITKTDKFNVTTVGPTSNSCDGSNVCLPNPCRDPVKSYCIDEWEAYKCVDPGKCKSKPCKNGGVCIPTDTSYKCNCRGNFTGPSCETPLLCLQSPCNAGEKCVADDQTVYKCAPIVKENTKTLSTAEVVMIVVFTLVGLALIVVIIYIWRRRQPSKTKQFEGDFTADGREIEMKPTSKPATFENDGFESDQQSVYVESRQQCPQSIKLYENDAYDEDFVNGNTNMISQRNISTSQPAIQPPRSHRVTERAKTANRSLPILSYKGDRNERILQDLRGANFPNSQLDSLALEAQLRRSNERFQEIPVPSKLGTATPPFESGFESTGSDIESERDHGSVTDIVDGSSQLEMYDLEVASIGFSEMSWQNDNNSSNSRDVRRDFIDKRLDRLKHLVPQFNMYDYGSTVSDRHTRSDRLSDRLSDLVEQDSSSDSDGSFTGSEYEYGDERISTNKLNRKHLVFSRHPQMSDSEGDSSFMPRRNSVDSSITNLTDVGSIKPMLEQKDTQISAIPSIDWDQLLNWAMKYENLSSVYRELAALGDNEGRPARISSARASERRKRDQEHVHKPVKFLSAQELHQTEEYV